MRGTMDNRQTVHDIDAERVLNGGYLRLHEVSREKDAKGVPAYEAIVFISVDATPASTPASGWTQQATPRSRQTR